MPPTKERLNILLNGSELRKVVLKSDTWEALLAECSRKLGLEPPRAVTRIFSLEGFELDELEDCLPGETIVCSTGEDYGAALSLSVGSLDRMPSSSSINSVPSESASVVVPSHVLSTASAASLASSTSSAGAPAVVPAASIPPPPPPPSVHAHLTVLQSAPLVSRGPDGQLRPLPILSLPAERDQLLETLREAGREMSVRFETATTDALRASMTMGTTILHWSGHGEEGYMAFEDGAGGTHELTPTLLASTCLAGDAASTCKLVFVCACHSQPTAMAFVRAGVPHVVAVRSQSLVLDAAAVTFTKHFYLSLSAGQSVQTAFDVGLAAVGSMPSRMLARQSAAGEAAKFVLLPAGGHHSTAMVLQRPSGGLTDKTRPLCLTNVPAPSENFVGRQRQMQQAVAALCGPRRRCVVLVGAGGIGKTALGASVCHYVRLRHCFPDGVYHIEVRGLASTLQLTYAIASSLQLPGLAEWGEAKVAEEVIGALSLKQVCLRILLGG